MKERLTNSGSLQSHEQVVKLVEFSLLLALEALVCFTPLGSIPIGPMVATLMMAPVIVTGILLGPKLGTAMGTIAGLFSFIVWTFMPPSPLAFVFTPFYSLGEISGNVLSLVICFIPRALTGFIAGALYNWMKKKFSNESALNSAFSYIVPALVASFVNTFLVLGGIYLFFGEPYAQALGVAYEALLALMGTTVLTNGIPEAIVCALIAFGVCKPIEISRKKRS